MNKNYDIEFSDELNNDARTAIIDYCKQRGCKCKGCRYSIDWLFDKVEVDRRIKYDNRCATCIFANCPESWTKH